MVGMTVGMLASLMAESMVVQMDEMMAVMLGTRTVGWMVATLAGW